MDKTVSQIIAALKADVSIQVQSLGDYPKAEQFEHGVQVGLYRGLQKALDTIANVLEKDEEIEARR